MTDLPTRLAALRQRLDALDQNDPVVRDLRARLDRLETSQTYRLLVARINGLKAEIAEREGR